MIYPNLFGTKLENLEVGRLPSWFVRTDACTGHGGGGWLSKSPSWVPGAPDSRCFALRWTADELVNINRWLKEIPLPSTGQDLEVLQGNLHHYCSDGTVPTSLQGPTASEQNLAGFPPSLSVDINVLEFATAVFAMMLWAPIMQGCCVCLGADNTTTLCWLVKYKTTNQAADLILKLLALTCAVYNIQLVTEFIPGVKNVLADWLSRVSGGARWDVAVAASELCGGSQGFFRENLHSMAKDPDVFSRRLVSRTLLMRSLTFEEPVVFQTLLAMILALKGVEDKSCDIADDEVKGTLDGIARALLSSADDSLVVSMDFEVAVAQFRDRPTVCEVREPTSHKVDDVVETFNVPVVSRVLLPRQAKSRAVEAIRKAILEPPLMAYRIREIADLQGVQVAVAPSRIPGAGLGLFLMRGPASDGSAPKGTRLATYEGRRFVSAADIGSIENLEYQSDYLWGKLNPRTNVYTIVDAAAPKSCYTRYVNEGFFESNSEVELGTDDVLYLAATTHLSLYEELTMPYGAPYWMLPERWMSLPPALQAAVLQFYDCAPPRVNFFGTASEVVGETGNRIHSCFGPAFSSDNAGDGPRDEAPPSGWGGRRALSRTFGRGWSSILSRDAVTSAASRDRLRDSFPLLQLEAMASCHAPSTLRSYGSGWKSWSRYCVFFELNPLCIDVNLAPLTFPVILAQIQNYIHFECAVRQLQPDSIKNVYLTGIADYFDRHGALNRFREASNHNCVQLLLTSYSRSWKKKHPDSTKVKIAFGLSYAVHAERLILSGTLAVGGCNCADRTNLISYMVGVRVVTALWMGIFFLLRKNEFLPHPENRNDMQEPCRRRNLRFFDGRRLEIPYDRIGLQRAASVSLTLRFSKTDQTGHGRIVHHESTDDPVICVVHRLEEYIRVSRDYFHASVDSLLFSVPGLPSDLSSGVLTERNYNGIGPPRQLNFGAFFTVWWSYRLIAGWFSGVYNCLLWWMGKWLGCNAPVYRSNS